MNRAFSLVELSIVLVILGLLTGGILAGQNLIKASQLRGVSTEFSRYMTAFSTFRDKYFSLPGDMTNATNFWGTDPGGCPGDNSTSTTPRSTTCNGDGNSRIETTAPLANEVYRLWQQLADAGLVEGSYTGVQNNTAVGSMGASLATPNVPASRYNTHHWQAVYVGTVDYTNVRFFDGNYGNALLFGNAANSNGGVMLPEEAWNLDTKLDDGKPGTGNVTSFKSAVQANAATGCSNINQSTTVSIAAASAYLLTNSSGICSLAFKTGM